MSAEERRRWDERYTAARAANATDVLPEVFAPLAERFPRQGLALELACGQGGAARWLARRGMQVRAVDVSAVAIEQARVRTAAAGLAERCCFDVFDLDAGLPATAPVDLLLCHNFRDPRLYGAMVDRLAPGGLLAIATLSEVGAAPGRFRARHGELRDAFATLTLLEAGEARGQAWFVGRRDLCGAHSAQPLSSTEEVNRQSG